MDESKFKKSQKKLLDQIQQSYEKHKLIPFIGAGFSKNVEGFPDWDEFIEQLSENMGKNKAYLKNKFSKTAYASSLAAYYSLYKFRDEGSCGFNYTKMLNVEKCKQKLTKAIEEYLDQSIQNKKSPNHELLTRMFPYIYTTNWDDLIEINSKPKIKKVYSISHIIQISDWKEKNAKQKLLIKMHGSYEDWESIIATDVDYLKLVYNKDCPLNIKFQNDILHKDFLFLGFSFSDININNLVYPIYLAKENIEPKEKTRIFMLSFSEYDPIMDEYHRKFKGIDIYFLDIAPSDRKTATERFLKYIKGSRSRQIVDSKFKRNLINYNKKEIQAIKFKIDLLEDAKKKIPPSLKTMPPANSNIDHYKKLETEFNKHLAGLIEKQKFLEDKQSKLKKEVT